MWIYKKLSFNNNAMMMDTENHWFAVRRCCSRGDVISGATLVRSSCLSWCSNAVR